MRGALDAGNFQAQSQGLQAMMDECGEYLGDGSALGLQVGDGTGGCPDNGSCNNFYTIGNLLRAIDEYNQGKDSDKQFPQAVRGSRCLTLAAFLGQTVYESGNYRACKEYVQPCQDPSKCSGGRASDYSPVNQGDWLPKSLPDGSTGPSSGCTDYWGNSQSDSAHCWFGRGAIQISWLPNYLQFYPDYFNNPDLICEDGKVGWIGSVAFWKSLDFRFDGTCESATTIPNPANCDAECIRARCAEQSKYEQILVKADTTSPPSPSPSPSGSYTVPADVAAGGCWNIMNTVCPGQGNQWSENLCSPAHAPGVCPTINGGDTIQYNCNGCN